MDRHTPEILEKTSHLSPEVRRRLSKREVAGKLGIALLTLQRHVAADTIDAPPLQKVGGVSVRVWSARDIEKARKVLAKIKPGRKKK